MGIKNLTTKEIEEKIGQYCNRTETLKDIINEIKDLSAKATLQLHLNNYQASLDELRKELEKRNS